MLPSFLIGFRETLEAALVIGIILAFLEKTGRSNLNRHVYAGAAAGAVASLFLGIGFFHFAGGLEGANEKIFEGLTLLFASLVLTYMIFYMASQRRFLQRIQREVDAEAQKKHKLGLALLSFTTVLREGVETVLFLGAAVFVQADGKALLGALLGIAAAVFLGFLMLETSLKLDVKKLFQLTSILLLFFAAGLATQSAHEFQELGIIPVLADNAWDTEAFLNQQSGIGRIARSLFGYSDRPAWLEVGVYLAYLCAVGLAYEVYVHRSGIIDRAA